MSYLSVLCRAREAGVQDSQQEVGSASLSGIPGGWLVSNGLCKASTHCKSTLTLQVRVKSILEEITEIF